jgi:hypothetical protein
MPPLAGNVKPGRRFRIAGPPDALLRCRPMSPIGKEAESPPAGRGANLRTSLNIVRLALVMGVIAFGAVAFIVQRTGAPQLASAAAITTFKAAAIALLAAGVGALVVLRSRLGDITDPAKQRTMCIIGYALCEPPALAGGVIWMMGGGPLFYGLGLGLMLTAATLLWPPSAETS